MVSTPRFERSVGAIAFAIGAASLAVEIAAVRLIAPWFGATTTTWTHVIAVVLLGLALGYLIGARGARTPATLPVLLLAAAAWIAWLPGVARPTCRWFMDEALSIQDAPSLWTWGSLAVAIALLLAPMTLLGAATPALLALAQRSVGSAGRAAGRVIGASTLGGACGALLVSNVMAPSLGLDATMIAWSLVLVVGAALALRAPAERGDERAARGRAAPALAAVAWILALAFSRFAEPAPPAGMRQLASAQSAYQWLRVVEEVGGAAPMRWLQANDGRDGFQSVWRAEPGLLGQGYYYDYFALPAWWSRASGAWKVLALGAGAGTSFRVLEGASPPGVAIDAWGAEIDRAVVELGERWLGLDRSKARWIVGEDGRRALRRLPKDFDLIVVDAYQNDVEIPSHLATLEFFREAREHLTSGGWLAANVGGFDAEDPLVEGVARTLCEAFEGGVLAARVPAASNFVLFARRGATVPSPEDPVWSFGGPIADALLPSLELPGALRRFEPSSSGEAWTDVVNPIEIVQRESLLRNRSNLEGTATHWLLSQYEVDGAASAAGDPIERVRTALAERRLADAARAARSIEDPVARAEWSFHVLFESGDLRHALEAALEGLQSDPLHPGLLHNATVCALRLKAAEVLAELQRRIARASAADGRAAVLPLGDEVARVLELDSSRSRRLARSIAFSCAALVAAAAALLVVAFARAPSSARGATRIRAG